MLPSACFAVIADRCLGSTVIDDITRAVQGYALHGILRANRLLHISSNVILPGDARTFRRQVRCVGCIELYHVIELFRVPVRSPSVSDVSICFSSAEEHAAQAPVGGTG